MSGSISSFTQNLPPGSQPLDRWAASRLQRVIGSLSNSHMHIAEEVLDQPPPGMVQLQIHNPRAYRRVLGGGSIGAAESYMDGDWDTNDLVGLCRIFGADPAALHALDGGLLRLSMPALRAIAALRRNTRRGSRRNIAAHYDLGNEFYAAWLDSTMTYSSAVFMDEREDLAEASIRKLDRMCRLARITAGDHVLEIGGGWGSFAIHAAKHYDCRVTTTTISREQYAHMVRRVADAGLSDRVTVLQQDYRDLRGQFDKVVSIEMIEAVGPQYLGQFVKTCASLLKPEGVAAIQVILIRDQDRAAYLNSVDFIRKHIFPGGSLPSLSAIVDAAGKTDLGLVSVDDITPHYAVTLRRWRERFLQRECAIRAQGFGDRFIRMWEFYLAYCEAGFAERKTMCAQLLLARPGFRTGVGAVS